MAKENNSSATGRIGFFGLLQIAFIILKLCGVLECSWAAVFIPVYIWLGLVILLFSLGAFLGWIAKKL